MGEESTGLKTLFCPKSMGYYSYCKFSRNLRKDENIHNIIYSKFIFGLFMAKMVVVLKRKVSIGSWK